MVHETSQLKARIAHLEEELLYAHSVLSQTTETGCFHQSLNRYTSAQAILHDADKKVRLILPLMGTAFYLINEESADLELCFLQAPKHITNVLPLEWSRLLEERLVAQALHTNQTIFRSTRDRDALWILHSIATQSRVRGLFLGLLGIPRENLRDSALSLLHVALANLAHTLESFELYRMMRTANSELQALVQELSLARGRFQAIFEFLPMPAAIIDATGPSVTTLNAQARCYGTWTQQDLPQPLNQIFPCIAEGLDLTGKNDAPQSFGPLPCSCSGQQRWLAGQVLLVWPNQYLLLFEDRTHQRTTELALEKTRRITRMLEDNARDLTVAVDLSGTVTYATPSAQTLLGYDPARLVGSPASTILPPTALQALQTAAEGHTLTLEADALTRTGETIPCEIMATPLRDTQGHWDQVMMVVRDLRERRALEARIAHQSLYDGLTGLPQRSLFLSFIQRAIQAKRRTPHILPTVLLMEISRFAQIGASLGPHVADDLLLHVGGRIQQTLRSQDALARLGTAEFGILVDNAPDGRTMLRLQR